MFQGFFEWLMGVITYVLSFFGIIISKPSTGSVAALEVAPAAVESEVSELQAELSSPSSLPQ